MTTRRRLRALLIGASLISAGPVGLGAQATSTGAPPQREVPPTTHTVKRGDTLWDLAGRYLGNPFRWPEIYRRNTDRIQDPDLIEPGWVLVISGDPAVGSPASSVGSEVAPPRAPLPAGAAPSSTTPRPAASVETPRVIGGDAAALWAARRREAERVPFLVGLGGMEGAGRLVRSSARRTDWRVATAPRRVQHYDRVRLLLPRGSAVTPGMLLLTLRYGPTLKKVGRVVIPTGVLRVVSDSAGGIAELVTMFEAVEEDHLVVPAWTPPAVTDSVPARVPGGPSTAVLWIAGGALLPSPGTSILLSRGTGEGLRVGDQVTLVRQDRPSRRGAPMPAPVDLAVAQVVRVTRTGASAVLLSQVDGAIAVGTTGRVTARLP